MKSTTLLAPVALLILSAAAPGLAADPAYETPTPVDTSDHITNEAINGSGLILDPSASPDGATLQFAGRGPRGRFAIS